MAQTIQKFTIVAEGNAGNHPVGTVCYEFLGHDYGCAREDTFGFGEPWISLTLESDGFTGPFFTAPCRTLYPQPMGHYWSPKFAEEER